MKKIILSVALMLCCGATIGAADMKGKKVYINPGHGGYWNGGTIEQEVDANGNVITPRKGNDRFVATIPFPNESEEGYWESKSNLVKGLELQRLLEAAGCEVKMSRTTNTEADDKDLKAIGLEANDYLGAAAAANPNDVAFISIHSNALGTNSGTNYFLNLYNMDNDGIGKNATYMALGQSMATNSASLLMDNEITVWSPTAPKIWEDQKFLGYTLGVLRHLNVPGFLVEGSFHDYQPETHRLLNDDYCKLAAYNMYRYFCEYFMADKPTTGVVAGAVKDDQRIIKEKQYKNWVKGTHDRFQPINGAKVSLLDASGNTVKTYTTDNNYNGVYVFWDVTPGAYKVKMEADGYETQTIDVTVVASEIADQVTLLHDPNYVEPEPVLGVPNVFASALKSTQTAEGKYQIDFTLNTAADDVTVNVYSQDENAVVLVKSVSYGAKAKGANSVELDLAGVSGTGLTWAVEATGPSTATVTPTNFIDVREKNVQFKGAAGVEIDNDTESEYFGRIYVANTIPGATDNRTVSDGIYILDATFGDVTGQGDVAYNGNAGWVDNAALTSCASPHRIALDKEGHLFIGDWSDTHSGVWVMDVTKPSETFKSVFSGSRNGDGVVSSNGVSIHGSISALEVVGEGENRTLVTYDEDLEPTSLTVDGEGLSAAAGAAVFSYNIGTLTNNWTTAPTGKISNTTDIAFNCGQQGYVLRDDQVGGVWVSQRRYGGHACVPALVHYNKDGVADYTRSVWGGAGNLAVAINAAGNLLAVTDGTRIYLCDLSYDENGVPVVERRADTEFDLDLETGNGYGLAFDAADNLYRASSSDLYLQGFAMPKENNSHETKAPSKYTLNGASSSIEEVSAAKTAVTVTGDELTITSTAEIKSVAVYSTSGVTMYANYSVCSETETVNVAAWANGLYIVKVDNKVYKIVK